MKFGKTIAYAIVSAAASILLLQACGSRDNNAAPAPTPAAAPTCPSGQTWYPQYNQCLNTNSVPNGTAGYTHFASVLSITDQNGFKDMVKQMTGLAGQLYFCWGSICPNYNSAVSEIYYASPGNGMGEAISLSISPNNYGASWNVTVPMSMFIPTANSFVLQQNVGYNYIQIRVDNGSIANPSFDFRMLYKGSVIAVGTMYKMNY